MKLPKLVRKQVKRWKGGGKSATDAEPVIERRDSEGSINEIKDLSGRFCPKPFTQFDIYEHGNAYCCCSSWVTTPIGNVKHEDARDIWNSDAAQAIRKSIFDGSFSYCDHKICPMIQNDTLPTIEGAKLHPAYKTIIEEQKIILDQAPSHINFCNDPSCNLSCPSCRIEKILLRTGSEYEERKQIQDAVRDGFFSEPTDQAFSINVTGSGDPFASKIFRDFLTELDGDDYPNMAVNLQTNGVLFTPTNWRRIEKIHKNINQLFISFDAATPETYAITRRGGNWEKLLENMAFLVARRREGLINAIRMDFVVQADNYREMPDFVRLARTIGVDSVYFSMVIDWGTWPSDIYESKCIWKENNPHFSDFLGVLADPAFDDPLVDMGNLTEYRSRALAA